MPRPPGNTDQLLIQAARELLPETGCARLSLRQVAARAGVNLGMFHYHFKTRSEFLRQVLNATYEEFFQEFSADIPLDAEPIEQLRAALKNLGRTSRKYRQFISMLISDVMAGEKEAIEFALANAPRHISIMIEIIEACRKNHDSRIGTPNLAMAFIGAVGFPNVVIGTLERKLASVLRGGLVEKVSEQVLSDAAIDARVNWVLKGVFGEKAGASAPAPRTARKAAAKKRKKA